MLMIWDTDLQNFILDETVLLDAWNMRDNLQIYIDDCEAAEGATFELLNFLSNCMLVYCMLNKVRPLTLDFEINSF